MQEQAPARSLAGDEVETLEVAVVSEEARAVTGQARSDHQAQFIDQVRCEKRPGEREASVDADGAAWPPFQFAHERCGILRDKC